MQSEREVLMVKTCFCFPLYFGLFYQKVKSSIKPEVGSAHHMHQRQGKSQNTTDRPYSIKFYFMNNVLTGCVTAEMGLRFTWRAECFWMESRDG